MPPSGFRSPSVLALLMFVKANYEELRDEVRSGKHPTMEAAIDYEIDQLGKALSKVHINEAGALVERA